MRGERGGAIFIFHVLNAFEESARKNVAIHGDLRQRSTNKRIFPLSFYPPPRIKDMEMNRNSPLPCSQSCLHFPYPASIRGNKFYSTSVPMPLFPRSNGKQRNKTKINIFLDFKTLLLTQLPN